MRQTYLLIALLCCIAGAVDAFAYLHLGRLFVANLTGNTVLFAYDAVEGYWMPAAERLGIILAFVSGVVTNRLLMPWIGGNRRVPGPTVMSLAIECCVLCVLALVSLQGYLQLAMLLILAWTMGLQNDAFQAIGPINLNTAFLTGDMQKLGSAIASLSGDPDKRKQRRQQIAAYTSAWVAYAGGAALSAIGSRLFQMRALLIPAVTAGIILVIELGFRSK